MEQITAALRAAGSLAVLTGAGVSAESGLPTFRGVNGLWRSHRVEELASPDGFARDPHLVWTWYNERRAAHAAAQPNAAHLAIAALEERFEDFTLITQNVDSLHLRAGSRNVLELHGNLREARCNGCGARRAIGNGIAPDEIGHDCGGLFRPDIVWFGEGLDPNVWERATDAARRAEVLLVVGTSSMVNPAAALATHYAQNAFVVEVNPEPTAISERCDAVVREPASSALTALLESLWAEL